MILFVHRNEFEDQPWSDTRWIHFYVETWVQIHWLTLDVTVELEKGLFIKSAWRGSFAVIPRVPIAQVERWSTGVDMKWPQLQSVAGRAELSVWEGVCKPLRL